MSILHDKLCAVADHALAGTNICYLNDNELVGIGSCTSLSIQKCGWLTKCTSSPQHSFTFEGGSVHVSTCMVDTERVITFWIGLVTSVIVVCAALFVIGRHIYRGNRSTQLVSRQLQNYMQHHGYLHKH